MISRFVGAVAFLLSVGAFSFAAAPAAPTTTSAPTPTLIILDASGSMRGRIGGETKMEIARRAVRELVERLPDSTVLGLVAYSHRRSNDCADIELLIPPGPLDRAAFIRAVDTLQPRGLTPLSGSLSFAAQAVDYKRQPANLILVSDGLETCGQDPCATVRRLKQEAAGLTVHTVAFDLSAREAKSIACIAAATGGRFLQANDAASLKDALDLVVVESVVAAPAPAAAPPTPEPEKIETATISAPAEVVVGASFEAAWTGPDNPSDYLTIVPKGTPEDEYLNFTYTRRGSPLPLTAPIEPGEAEVRYVTGRSRKVLARASVRVLPASVTIEAAPEAIAGSAVTVSWGGPANAGDYVTIVPRGTADGEYAQYTDVRHGSPLQVTAPVEPGEAEIRYMSGQGRKVLARRPITLVRAEVSLDAPAEATVGSIVAVQWAGPKNPGDFLTIVAKSAPDNASGNYADASRGSPVDLTAPIEAGEVEIRYVSGQGRKVLARRLLKLTTAQVALSAPAEVVAGAIVSVEWTGPNNPSDYITIVPRGAPDRSSANYSATSRGSPLPLTAPIEAGDAEIRYVSGQGNKVLARRPITIVLADVTLDAPAEAVIGSIVGITWTGPNNAGDYITIVPKGSPDRTSGNYLNSSRGSPLPLPAPIEPGEVEVRYVSGQGNKVLGRRALLLVPAKIELRAPASAPAKSAVSIEWTGPNNSGDYITIVPVGTPERTSGHYAFTRSGSVLKVNAPAQPGRAEIRYVSGQGNKPLGRIEIDITAP